MKKNNIKILIGLIILTSLVLSINYFQNNKVTESTEIKYEKSEAPSVPRESKEEVKVIQEMRIPSLREQEVQSRPQLQFKIVAQGKSHDVNIPEGSTLYEAMNILSDKNSEMFTFEAKDYGTLGYFIHSINGVPGSPGKYWVYYINGESATLGVSKYIIKNGDTIEWKQEGK